MQGNEGNLAQISEEHIRRVEALYESKAKSFHNLFTGLMTFTLAFFFLILLPYFFIQRQGQTIAENLQSLQPRLEEYRQNIAGYEKLNNGIATLRKEITDSPKKLREFIHTLQNSDAQQAFHDESQIGQEPNRPSFQEMVQQQFQENFRIPDPCQQLTDNEWVECKVGQEVLKQFSVYDDVINRDILNPLKELPVAARPQFDTSVLKSEFDTLREEFNRKLEANPKFWHTLQGKGEFFVGLDEEIMRLWSKYSAALESQNEKLLNEADRLQKEKADLEIKNKELEKAKQDVTVRLSEMESPLGKLPVGINEAILVYPLVVAIGFWLCTSLFCETARLRWAFHDLYQQKDPQKNILTDQQVALVAPLWIDPIDVEQNRSQKFAILLLPFVFFIISCILISCLWALSNGLSSPVPLWMYGGLYVLSLGFFCYGYWQVIGALRQYRRE